MKINEIDYDIGLNSIEKPVTNSPWATEPGNPRPRETNPAFLGKGVSGAAYSLKDQQSIVRIAHKELRPANEDPYLRFLEVAQSNQGNPFVPKLYNIKKFVAPLRKDSYAAHDRFVNTRNFYYVNMEKLTSIDALTIGQVISSYNLSVETSTGEPITLSLLSNGAFADDDSSILGETIFSLKTQYMMSMYKREFLYEFRAGLSNIFEKYVSGSNENYRFSYMNLQYNIHNEQLLSILKLLNQVVDYTGVGLDLHLGNILYRTTPYGAQPVITDPFV